MKEIENDLFANFRRRYRALALGTPPQYVTHVLFKFFNEGAIRAYTADQEHWQFAPVQLCSASASDARREQLKSGIIH